MERKEGRGQPGAPRNNLEGASPKEQGRREKESTANNSPVSSVQQKSPDKLSPEPKSEKKGEKISVHNPGRTAFDCVVPKVRPDCLFLIRRMLQDTNLTKKEAQKLEQEWRESLRTMDRKTLEKELKESEKRWKRFNESHKRGGLTALGQALLPVLDEEMEVIQKALHRRLIE